MSNPIVQIDRVSNREEYQPDGKKYKILTATCDGFIDGEPSSGFLVKAIGAEKIRAVAPGLTFEAEIDNYKGKHQYVLPKDFRPLAHRSSPAPQAPQAGRRQAAQPGGMSMEAFDELFRHAIDVVADKLVAYKCTEGDGEETCPDPDALAKLTSTYVIAAMDNGIRPKVEQPAPEEKPVDMNLILEVLEKKGLTKRVEDAGIEEQELINLWKGSGDSPLKFGILVNERLKSAEQSPSDDVPF